MPSSAKIFVHASGKVWYRPTCMRCVTTAVGTRTRHAATSPQLAAKEWCSQLSLPPLSSRSRGFMPSYAEKNMAEPGAAPSAVARTPR